MMRRHFPVVITSGMFDPDGMLVSEKWPVSSVWTGVPIGEPGSESVHWLHVRPVAIGPGSLFGTYTLMP